MRRVLILVLMVCLGLSIGVVPALAQSITGISLRPAEAAPMGSSRGLADVLEANGGYKVSVDLSNNAQRLKLESYTGAEAFVVWAVDMEGVPHNIGVLDDDLVLEDATTDFVVAKLIVTVEASADATAMQGPSLFEATLRHVVVKTGAPAPGAAVTLQQPTKAPEATAEPTPEPTAEAKAAPSELPTTGSVAQDLLVLAVLAGVLLAAGLRLRTIRL